MAARKSKTKRYAVQRHIEVAPGSAVGTDLVVDIPASLSKLNHRLYRQSRVYTANVRLTGPAENGRNIDVYVLRDTWMLQKAYQMAKDTFDKNMSEERDVVKNTGRWNDFRISPLHKTGAALLNPLGRAQGNPSAISSLTAGDFTNSQVYDESGAAKGFGLWSNQVQYNIVEEYDKSANTDASPSSLVGTDTAYDGLDDDLQTAARQHLETSGDLPPYNQDSLESAQLLRKVGTLGDDGAGSAKTSTGVFEAPLGLVILADGDIGGTLEIAVNAGDYKGVHGVKYIEDKKFGHRRG
jgi:hypothetical protein